MSYTKDTRLQRNEDIVSSEIDDETVMMDKDFENYFGLQDTGTEIWRLLEKPTTIQQICDCLSEKYEVSPEQCMSDIQPFIEDLLENEMILRV